MRNFSEIVASLFESAIKNQTKKLFLDNALFRLHFEGGKHAMLNAVFKYVKGTSVTGTLLSERAALAFNSDC